MVIDAVLPQPGVTVRRKVTKVTRTVLSPTLVPTVLGAAYQVLSLFKTTDSGSRVLNGDANLLLPAVLVAKAATGSPAVYNGLDGKHLGIATHGMRIALVTFSDPYGTGLTPATIVDQVQTALSAANVTSVVAETYESDSWLLRTVAVGDFAELEIHSSTAAEVLTLFAWAVGVPYSGFDAYRQYRTLVPSLGLPDPSANLDQLSVDLDSIRFFLGISGANIVEARRNAAIHSYGSVASAAVSSPGSVDLSAATYPLVLTGLHLSVTVDSVTQDFSFAANPTSAANLLAALNNATTGVHGLTASLGTGGHLVFTHSTGGYDHSFSIAAPASSSAVDVLGLGAVVGSLYRGGSVVAADDGDGDQLTSLIDVAGADFTRSVGTNAVLTASAAPTFPVSGTLVVGDTGQPRTVTFAAAADIAAVVSAVNAVCGVSAGGKLTASSSSGKLSLTHSDYGSDGVITIIGGTAVSALDPGATPTVYVGATATGLQAAPQTGDALYVNGMLQGYITRVAPGAVATRLKLDRYLSISPNVGDTYYIVANNLTNLTNTTTRPAPELAVTLDGSVLVKGNIIRDYRGVPTIGASPAYITYKALRLDLSPRAKVPGLVKLQGVDAVSAALAPISTENPFGLGMYFAALNAPGVQISGLSVPEVSDEAPYGTATGYAEAAKYLEAYEVYAIAPMTDDAMGVGNVMFAHVNSMSDPDMRGERIALLSTKFPTRHPDTLVASGIGGATGETSFDTRTPNLTTFVAQGGVTPVGTIPVSAGLFLTFGGVNYSISAMSSGVVFIRTSFGAGQNTDNFYSTTPFVLPVIDVDYSIRVRGPALVDKLGKIDTDGAVNAICAIAQSYCSSRIWLLWPDMVGTSVLGSAQKIPGFYAAACVAGMIGQYSPSQSFTNYPVMGLDAVYNVGNGIFSTKQLDKMAANGVYILYQPDENGAVASRMALTTDNTSLEMRTDSITKVLDYCSKQFRMSLRAFMGRNNISQGFIDSLNTVVESVISRLKSAKIVNDIIPDKFTQDTSDRDRLLITVTIDPPIPCNGLDVTIVI